MHMADALLSPAVATTMYAATAAAAGYSIHRLKKDDDPQKLPVMAVTAALVASGALAMGAALAGATARPAPAIATAKRIRMGSPPYGSCHPTYRKEASCVNGKLLPVHRTAMAQSRLSPG